MVEQVIVIDRARVVQQPSSMEQLLQLGRDARGVRACRRGAPRSATGVSQGGRAADDLGINFHWIRMRMQMGSRWKLSD